MNFSIHQKHPLPLFAPVSLNAKKKNLVVSPRQKLGHSSSILGANTRGEKAAFCGAGMIF